MFLEVKATRDFSELRGAFERFVRDDFFQLIFVCGVFGALSQGADGVRGLKGSKGEKVGEPLILMSNCDLRLEVRWTKDNVIMPFIIEYM